jgi:DNA invertase Pin-like site-specific DNA recombinase
MHTTLHERFGTVLQQVAKRHRKPHTLAGSPRVVAYLRVSTEEQGSHGTGIDAQRVALEAELGRRGWSDVAWVFDPGYSAKDLARPGIQNALAMLSEGRADVLMVSKLDRLSRSLLDFASLMERCDREGWSLVALDLGVDTTTPQGEMMAGVLAVFAQFERRLIKERTKVGLAVRKAQGVRIGRPNEIPAPIRDRIRSERAAGMTYAAIADRLTSEGIPTARGGSRWYASSVQAAERAQAD